MKKKPSDDKKPAATKTKPYRRRVVKKVVFEYLPKEGHSMTLGAAALIVAAARVRRMRTTPPVYDGPDSAEYLKLGIRAVLKNEGYANDIVLEELLILLAENERIVAALSRLVFPSDEGGRPLRTKKTRMA